MKSEITNKISNEDYRKIQSMVLHHYNGTPLHPAVVLKDEQYRIDGISHLDTDKICKVKTHCCLTILQEAINTEWNIDKSVQHKKQLLKSIKKLDNTSSKEDYVYDISMGGLNHTFFADNILVHNTDSVVLIGGFV